MKRAAIKTLVGTLAAAGLVLLATPAMAFHSGGVAECEGCHTMHNSENGQSPIVRAGGGGATPWNGVQYLLRGTDQSSTCLNCHASTSRGSYHVMDTNVTGAPGNYTPGGDFAWLSKTYNYTLRGTAYSDGGERAGHNIVAADYGLVADAQNPTGPGGSGATGVFDATKLHCSSCHDPHGQSRINASGTLTDPPTIPDADGPIMSSGSYGAVPTGTNTVGVYRLLGGVGFSPKSLGGAHIFANSAPIAVAPSSYNKGANTGGDGENTDQVRVAYGAGMSEWCANCHASIHSAGLSTNIGRHPAGNAAKLISGTAANYNAYVKSGDLSGAVGSSYLSLVPFEEGTNDRTVLAGHAVTDGSYKDGPTAASNVMCLSCHRAHASAFHAITRFDSLEAEFMVVEGEWPGTNAVSAEALNAKYARGMTVAEHRASYYDRDPGAFAFYQRSLCNKCHAKD